MSGGKTSALGKEVSGRYVLLPLSKRALYSEFCGHPLLEQAGIPKRTAYDYEELARLSLLRLLTIRRGS